MYRFNLSPLMSAQNLNIADLSIKTGLHRNGIARMYNGQTDGIKFDTLEKLCIALKCSVADLIEIIPDDQQ